MMKISPAALVATLCILEAATVLAKPATNPMSLSGGTHDNHTPIEVTSNTLEVVQEQNRAVFSGHVVAIQGNVRLKADTMTIDYARKEAGSGESKARTEPANPVGNGAIRKINAEGNVFLSTPEETASGAQAVYDVDGQEIHLNNHVVLTRGQNTLKGEHLIYNFATGKSRITGGDQGSKNNGRVRALFVPDKK